MGRWSLGTGAPSLRGKRSFGVPSPKEDVPDPGPPMGAPARNPVRNPETPEDPQDRPPAGDEAVPLRPPQRGPPQAHGVRLCSETAPLKGVLC